MRPGSGVTRVNSVRAVLLHPWAVALWGSSALLGLYLVARGDPDLARFFVFGVVLAALGIGVLIVYRGWQEDGLIGAFWSWYYPLGHLVEDPSGRRLAAVWLLAGAAVLAGLMIGQHPEMAGVLPETPGMRGVHDLVLPPGD